MVRVLQPCTACPLSLGLRLRLHCVDLLSYGILVCIPTDLNPAQWSVYSG